MAGFIRAGLLAIYCCWVPSLQAQVWPTKLLVAQSSQSQTLAQQVQQAEQLLLQGRLQAAFALLDTQAGRLHQHSKGWYIYGVLALRTGRYELAYKVLSRLVAQYPNHAGAQLDLALAALQLGHYKQAQKLLDQLLTYSHIPPGVSVLIASYQRQINAVTSLQHKPSASLTLETGFNSNINWGLLGEQVLLNTVNGPLTMHLSEADQARADSYQQLALVVDNTWRTAAARDAAWPAYQLQVTGQTRSYQNLARDHSQQLQAEFSHRLGGQTSNSRLTWQWHYHTQGDNQQRSVGVQAASKWQLASPQASVTGLTMGLKHLQNGHTGQYNYRQYYLQLDQEFHWHNKDWSAYAGINQQQVDNPVVNTSIPDYYGRVLGARVVLLNTATVNAKVGMEWRMDQDQQPYNSQIFGTTAKSTEQLRLQASISYNMGNNWHLIGKANWLQQQSNINLFTTRQWDASIAAQVQF